MLLSETALRRCEALVDRADLLNVAVSTNELGARLIDCGVARPGGLEAGRLLAEVCLAGLGHVSITPGRPDLWPGPAVTIRTDQPVAACLASQYAGWKINGESYFAMGSGPMRAVCGAEALFDEIGFREDAERTVGVLEASELPSESVCQRIAEKCRIAPDQLTLAVARCASIAGTVQVVARSVETALHKLHELHFDVRRVRSAFASAPLPPIAVDELSGIGRTNDSILYGAEVMLWVEGDDESIAKIGSQTPSCALRDYGQPFMQIFRNYDNDFYKIDPLLFSPAVVNFVNLTTGSMYRFGELRPDMLALSWT